MSVDVVDEIPQEAKHAADCYGTYDERYNECTSVCLIRKKCQKLTAEGGGVPQPVTSVLEAEEPPEMEPLEYFSMLCESSFSLNWKENDMFRATQIKKDGKRVAEVTIVKATGKIALSFKHNDSVVKLPNGLRDSVMAKALYQVLVGAV